MTAKGEHARRRLLNERRVQQQQVEAIVNNELHSKFFGVPNIPTREIRNRLDPILRAHEIREITKIYIGEEDDGNG